MGLFNQPLFRMLSTTKELDKYFTLEKRKEFYERYLQSVNLSKGLTGTDGFDKYQENRLRGIDDFLNLTQTIPGKDAQGKPDSSKDVTKPILTGPWDKLKDTTNPHVSAVRNQIQTALVDTPQLTGALKQFNEDIQKINAALAEVPPTIDPRNLRGILHVAKADAVDAIKAHQAQAKQQIEDLFTDSSFTDELKASMNLTDDTQLGRVKKEMLSALDKSNAEQLKQFEDSFNKSINDIHSLHQKEKDRIAFIAAMRQTNDKEFRDAINALAEKKKAELNLPPQPLQLSLQPDKNNIDLRGVNVADLPILKTITGRKIDIGEDGTMHLQLPKGLSFEGAKYYNSRHQNVDYDFQSLAEACKACGHDDVVINVDYKDEKEADEYARRMYEACVNAGFEPSKITVKVNGVERKLEEVADKEGKKTPGLFDGEPHRYGRVKEVAKAMKAEREKEAQEPKGADLNKYKKELQDLRQPPTPPVDLTDTNTPQQTFS
ncbi:hypothetical protein [Legionella cardiaca]|uniref:Coiled coil domain-containing protein n=1 Tax=Legionella cardiaca TaxID=1071983 RepID=A0ABY8ANN2_9GAMM|nr:hypothetical protein [Legionella cardiaca]WED42275.1 hypothetical protein PXX05_10085 [Legionella cardiaca]